MTTIPKATCRIMYPSLKQKLITLLPVYTCMHTLYDDLKHWVLYFPDNRWNRLPAVHEKCQNRAHHRHINLSVYSLGDDVMEHCFHRVPRHQTGCGNVRNASHVYCMPMQCPHYLWWIPNALSSNRLFRNGFRTDNPGG